jgi:hypothetical protein
LSVPPEPRWRNYSSCSRLIERTLLFFVGEPRLWLIVRLVMGDIERVRLVPEIGLGMQISPPHSSFAVNYTHRQDVDTSWETEKVLGYEVRSDHRCDQLFLLVSESLLAYRFE